MATYIHSKMTTNANKGHRIFGSDRSTKSSRNGGKGHVRFVDSLRTRNRGWALGASATITITDYTELNAGDIVNLVATDGTDYDFEQGDHSSVEGTFEAATSNTATATSLMNVINTSSGPAGTRFTATSDGAVVTVTQATAGADGNTTVTLTDSETAGMSKTDFIGGSRTQVKTAERLFEPYLNFGASKGTTYTGTTIGRTNTSTGDKDLIRDSAA